MKIFTNFIFTLALTLSLQADWKVAGDALKANDESSGDWFGWSVDVGDTYAIVGAPYESMGGAVYIFSKNINGEWIEMQKIDATDNLISPNGQFNSGDDVTLGSFGFDVAIGEVPNGSAYPSMIVVGAPTTSVYHEGNNVATGAFCTFALNTDANIWEQQEECALGLVFDVDGSYSSSFGYSVDISSWQEGLSAHARIIIGDPFYDQKNQDIGLAFFYAYDSSVWNIVGAVLGDGGATGSNDVHFGKSVAIYQDSVVVGSPGYNIYDPNDDDPNVVMIIHEVGAAHFFTSDGTLINTYTPPHEETAGEHHFGNSVDIYGDYAIVSEIHREGGNTLPAVYIMKKDIDDTWIQHNYIENGEIGYGYSVAINDTHAGVGVLNGPAVGAIYMYSKDANGNWNTNEPFYWLDIVKQSAFGIDVALYENRLMVGAPLAEEVKQFEFIPKGSVNPAIIMYLLN